MSSTQYDSSVLQKFADDLYGQARVAIITTALKFGLIAFIVAAVGSSILPHSQPLNFSFDSPTGLIGVVAAAVGVSVGRDRAFQLKLQAQQILCQRQIELNTRTSTDK